jgi:hypothetical protein
MNARDWSYSLNFSVYGARIGVRSNRAEALTQLLPVFPPHFKYLASSNVDWQYSMYLAPRARGRSKSFHVLYSNEKELVRSQDAERLVTAFDQDVQLAVAQKARGKVFVHAGVVGWRDRAVLIPGKSFTGKSTLVHALVRAGAVYYSDEFAVLDEQGRVHPFARLPALRDENSINKKIPFEEFGGMVGTRPIPVGTVVVTRFRANAKWRPRVLTPGVGTLELLANTVNARSGQPIVLEVLTRVAKNARILKSTRGEATALAQGLLDSLV